ncbi:purine permease [Paenibacillus marchantiophytorum]|uniref:Purine permease n=1 Tax=Paenibacillus marchantiophytorum TaxID=1619310 RepID=A0ABQ2BQN7_9BACL|nr:purine/pyrimidine permease [Paenibacillus marchantiophytorum]GGI43856.1 purine permease [Paenibacillus marchantiophytorum]
MKSSQLTRGKTSIRLALASVQWAFFILTGGLVAPIVVAAAFHLTGPETVGLLQRTLAVIGVSSLLQVLFGHKLPILEGPAGVWWGVFILLASSVAAGPASVTLLQQMEMGLLISGVLILLLSVFRVIAHVKKLFTPVVIGTYLLLLIFQFSSSIVKGILGVGYSDSYIHAQIALPALATLVFTFICGRLKNVFFRNFSVLLGVMFGYALFGLLGLIPAFTVRQMSLTLPSLFAWGKPEFNGGILLTTLVIALPLLINMIAAIVIVEKAAGRAAQNVYRRAGVVMGINQLLSGLFSAVGCVSNSHTAGFIASTQMTKRLPFILGCLIIIATSFFPFFTIALASIPVPVAFAVIFYSFTHLLTAGLREYEPILHEEKKLLVIGVALFAGVGSMFIPAASLAHTPDVMKPILNNGLIVGVLTSILFEQGIRGKDTFVSWLQTRSNQQQTFRERNSKHGVNDQSVL